MKKFVLALAALFALAVAAPVHVWAQEADEEEYEDEEEEEGFEDDEDEFEDEEFASEPEPAPAASAQAQAPAKNNDLGAEPDGVDIYDNTAGVSEENGLFKLDGPAADTFKTMTAMERANALMKLKIEQERLALDLERQRAEKKKVALSLEEAERNRAKKDEEAALASAAAEAKLAREEEEAAAVADKRKRDEELNKQIIARVAQANLSDPDQLNAVAQLMALAPGSNANEEAIAGLKAAGSNRQMSFDERYALKSIVGAGGNLSANIEDKEKKTATRVKKGSMLGDWVVESVTGTSVLLKKGETSKIMNLN
ncbi:MAG: hypothetical protein LBL52_04265 [Rickettsiales bacterium]|jgi:hypothetical protein|nr:hypothetical protein [Rickettsiales bacterium]